MALSDNDFVLDNSIFLWKYVDDTTASELICKSQQSKAQAIADEVGEWSRMTRVGLSHEKCKKLRISFTKEERVFPLIVINGENVKVVDNAKLLDVTISRDLTWNKHVSEVKEALFPGTTEKNKCLAK